MRVLLLSLTSPLPANNGVRMRTWFVLRALVSEGHEVVLVTFRDPRQQDGELPQLLEVCRKVIQVPFRLQSISGNGRYFDRAKKLVSPLPFGVAAARSPEMTRRITALLNQNALDVILCEQTELLVNLPAALPVPLIIDFHNVDHLIFDRYLRFESNPAKKLYAWFESLKLREWERKACRLARGVLVCSEHDRVLLQQLCPELRISVVPNVVDTHEYAPGDNVNARKILFQGGMDWYPNRDAVEFFATQIFALIRNQIPDAKFIVAGRNPPAEFRQRLSQIPGLEFTGTVPDMRAEIADAAVCVVPLRIGSGTRLKILEAAAMAKPIVSTRLGAEGLEFVEGREILLRDDIEEFAEAVTQLLKNKSLQRQLGHAARKRAEQQYGWNAMRTAIREVMEAVKEEHAAHALGSTVRAILL